MLPSSNTHRARLTFAIALARWLGCQSTKLGPTDPAELQATLEALAAFGPKHVGSDEGRAAAAYIQDRMQAIGLGDIRKQPFSFPGWQLDSASISVTVDGQAMSPGFDVFESSGSGHADAPIVWASTATDQDLAGLDRGGKIALVVRDPSFHLAAQFRNVIAKGASAMLYLSIAPSNLRQVGSVRFDWERAGAIPAITIGADDGAIIATAVKAGRLDRATIDVAVRSTPSIGANVVGTIVGERPEQIVVGAHYDSWFTGSTDNGGVVAELLALAPGCRHALPAPFGGPQLPARREDHRAALSVSCCRARRRSPGTSRSRTSASP